VRAMRALDGAPGVQKTSVFGTAVHAVVAGGGAAAPDALRRTLVDAGAVVRRIEPVEPSLEDVFLEVVAESGF
jgi:ABC-2 type transport system ATP-binding protein